MALGFFGAIAMQNDYGEPPRLTVQLTMKQHRELNRLVPWGVKSQLFRVIIEDLLDMLRKDSDAVLGALLTRSLKLNDFPSFGGKKQ